MRKVLSAHRSDIAELKRKNKELELALHRLQKTMGKPAKQAADEEPAGKLRFSAKGLATQRKRLGLSAADFGLLIGVSGQSIYKWEEGKVRPRVKQLQAIMALRGLGKREAAERLAACSASTAAGADGTTSN